MSPIIDGLPIYSKRAEWKGRHLSEILLTWPDRILHHFLHITHHDYFHAQQEPKSQNLEKSYFKFQHLLKEITAHS